MVFITEISIKAGITYESALRLVHGLQVKIHPCWGSDGKWLGWAITDTDYDKVSEHLLLKRVDL